MRITKLLKTILIISACTVITISTYKVFQYRARSHMHSLIKSSPKQKISKVLLVYYGDWNHINGIRNKFDNFRRVLSKQGIEIKIADTSKSDMKITFAKMPENSFACLYPNKYLDAYYGLDDNTKPCDAIHIVEPVGLQSMVAARTFMYAHLPFTMSSHINYDAYIKAYNMGFADYIVSVALYLFARHAHCMIYSSKSAQENVDKYYKHKRPIKVGNGIDIDIFNAQPLSKQDVLQIESYLQEYNVSKQALKPPYLLCVSRVAPEKNLEVFLEMKDVGTKILIGDGPLLSEYKSKYIDVIFVGEIKDRHELARYYKYVAGLYEGGDQKRGTFVFPSMSETFGVVMLEAMACGLGVAAFDCSGPKDVVTANVNGILCQVPEDQGMEAYRASAIANLAKIIPQAIELKASAVADSVKSCTWDAIANQWYEALCYIPEALPKKT